MQKLSSRSAIGRALRILPWRGIGISKLRRSRRERSRSAIGNSQFSADREKLRVIEHCAIQGKDFAASLRVAEVAIGQASKRVAIDDDMGTKRR